MLLSFLFFFFFCLSFFCVWVFSKWNTRISIHFKTFYSAQFFLALLTFVALLLVFTFCFVSVVVDWCFHMLNDGTQVRNLCSPIAVICATSASSWVVWQVVASTQALPSSWTLPLFWLLAAWQEYVSHSVKWVIFVLLIFRLTFATCIPICAVFLRVCMCAWALFSRSPTALLSHDVFRFVNAFRCTQLNDPFFTAPPASASWIRPRIISCYCCACRCAGFLLFFFLTTNCLTGSPFD